MYVKHNRLLELLRQHPRALTTTGEEVQALAIEMLQHRAARTVLQDENESLRADLGKPSDIEAIDERLAKVEDWLAVANPEMALQERFNRVGGKIDALEDRTGQLTDYVNEKLTAVGLDGVNRELKESFRRIDERIDKVAEIIGERIGGLVDDINALQKEAGGPGGLLDQACARIEKLEDIIDKVAAHVAEMGSWQDAVTTALDGSSAINAAWWQGRPNTARPYFPTGGATTAEAAADAVLPVPQRGDRVRLEGAQSVGYSMLRNGWFDVLGQSGDSFQVRSLNDGNIVGIDLHWVSNTHFGLKEVRHADQH